MRGCCWLQTTLLCWLVNVQGQQVDSLRGALEAISHRQRDLADTGYYIDKGVGRIHIRPEDDLQFYESREGFPEDGQPEDIGYGYQKSVTPHSTSIFEPVALPTTELGFQDNNLVRLSEKEFQRLASGYPGSDIDNSRFIFKYPRNMVSPNIKRSIFRERVDGNYPESMQHLYPKHESGSDDVSGPILIPSSFRERYPGRTRLPPNALALVRSFGGLDRDTETGSGDDDSDEYMNALNSIWEKFKSNAPEGFDSEELTESDIEELLNSFTDKDEKKRSDGYGNGYGNGYGAGYDFFNSPLTWNKRNKQRLDAPPNDGFFHALKFLSGDRDVLEALHDDDLPTEDNDEDVTKILLEQKPNMASLNVPKEYRDRENYKKRLWHDGPLSGKYSYHKRIAKRFPVSKRSSSNYLGSGEQSTFAKFHIENNLRQKKNVDSNGVVTDPKVAQEIKNIFATTGGLEKDQIKAKENVTELPEIGKIKPVMNDSKNKENEKTNSLKEDAENNTVNSKKSNGHEHEHYMHRRDRDAGQKEESEINSFSKPLEVKKKSIDWSDYFGIDRRRKKSMNNDFNDEWLLNQYLSAYSLTNDRHNPTDDKMNRGTKFDNLVTSEADYDSQRKGKDDIDNKLRAMEDLIVDEALKYTGAHEGITDSKEVKKVKERVMSKLAAAYSLEKMRRALGEFKSSIAAQKDVASSQNSTPKPEDKEDQKPKRVAVKKEKAEPDMKDKKPDKKSQEDNSVNYFSTKPLHPSVGSNNYIQAQVTDEEVCPVLEDVAGRCRQISIIAGDRGDLFLPLCTLHQICYLCGPELGTAYPGSCDISFLTEANTVCHDNDQCRFAARRMLAGMRALKGDPSPAGCDWGNNPCLARFLALATDR